MLDRLLQTLIASRNQAADDVLLEAVAVGNNAEKATAIDALIQRQTTHGLAGLIERYPNLPEPLQQRIIAHARVFHAAVQTCGRDESILKRVGAIRLIAAGRMGRLCHVLSENLHEGDETVAATAAEAFGQLAEWVVTETRRLADTPAGTATESMRQQLRDILLNRREIEQAISRALDLHRGRQGNHLLRAALLLADTAASKTLGILTSVRHSGQAMMIRRLQQPPEHDWIEAFLLGGSHPQVRSQFNNVFSRIDDPLALAALLRRTHWLKDHRVWLCVHQTQRGTWLDAQTLVGEMARRTPSDIAAIGDWIASSALADVSQDQRLEQIRHALLDHAPQRIRLLRQACARRREGSTQFLRAFLNDPDERIMRIAAREIARRRPPDCQNLLLQRMNDAPESVRRVIGRSMGESGFDHFWNRFESLDRAARKQAGRAMFKLLPDAPQRLSRKLMSPNISDCVRAMQIIHELKILDQFESQVVHLMSNPNPKIRSKAISLLGDRPRAAPGVVLERALTDADPRVRANAIEVIDARGGEEFVPMLAARAREGTNRERANAIRALSRMRAGTAATQLLNMLKDPRGEHRISALWALREIGWWRLVKEVAQLAKVDDDLKVRRYAMGVLKSAIQAIQNEKAA